MPVKPETGCNVKGVACGVSKADSSRLRWDKEETGTKIRSSGYQAVSGSCGGNYPLNISNRYLGRVTMEDLQVTLVAFKVAAATGSEVM